MGHKSRKKNRREGSRQNGNKQQRSKQHKKKTKNENLTPKMKKYMELITYEGDKTRDLLENYTKWSLVKGKNANLHSSACNVAVVIDQDRIIVLGGKNKNELIDTIKEYSIQANEWTEWENIKLKCFAHVAVTYKNKIYIHGGYAEKMLCDIIEIDPYKKTKQKLILEHRIPCAAHGGVVVGDTMYIFGGQTQQRDKKKMIKKDCNLFFALNLETKKWSQPKVHGELPGRRHSFGMVAIDNKIYIYGGRRGSEILAYADLHEYDTLTKTFTKIEIQGLSPKFYHVTFPISRTQFVAWGGTGNGKVPENHVTLIDLEYKKCKKILPSNKKDSYRPIATELHCGVYVEGSMYILGGSDKSKLRKSFRKCNIGGLVKEEQTKGLQIIFNYKNQNVKQIFYSKINIDKLKKQAKAIFECKVRAITYGNPPQELNSTNIKDIINMKDEIILNVIERVKPPQLGTPTSLTPTSLTPTSLTPRKNTKGERSQDEIIRDVSQLLFSTKNCSIHLHLTKGKHLKVIKKIAYGPWNREEVVHHRAVVEHILTSRKSNEYILEYYGTSLLYETFDITMEYAIGGNLREFYTAFTISPTERIQIARVLASQIAVGIKTLHDAKIAHLDIKSKNVVLQITDEKELVAKICDFGESKSNPNMLDTTTGTLFWKSPENIIASKRKRIVYDPYKADIWAFGCTILELMTGKYPWNTFIEKHKDKHNIEFLFTSHFIERGQQPEIPAYIDGDALDFLSCCLERNPEKRYGIDDVLNHAFLKERVPTTIENETIQETIDPLDYMSDMEDTYFSDDDDDDEEEDDSDDVDIIESEILKLHGIDEPEDDNINQQLRNLQQNDLEKEEVHRQAYLNLSLTEFIQQYINDRLILTDHKLKALITDLNRSKHVSQPFSKHHFAK